MGCGQGDGEDDEDGEGDGEGNVETEIAGRIEKERLGNLNNNERGAFLRKYIDATNHLVPIGNAVRISCNYTNFFFADLFLFAAHRLDKPDVSVRQ